MIKKIKIGYKDYVFEAMDACELATSGDYASINHRTGKIKYDTSIDDIENLDSILHEVLHGIYRQFGKDITAEEEEYCIKIFSFGLMGVFRDNPDLLVLMQVAFGHDTGMAKQG